MKYFNDNNLKVKTEYFTPPQFDGKTPFVEIPFWTWLDATYGGKSDWPRDLSFINAFVRYLTSLGFVEGVDMVSRETIDNHQTVFRYWHETAPIVDYGKPLEFDEIFYSVDKGGFYIYGLKKRHELTKFAHEKIISKCGMIYPCNSQNYYFQVINGFLFMKYQSILGSRCICSISGVPTE